MKRVTTCLCAFFILLTLQGQEISPVTEAFIKERLEKFARTMNNILTLDPYDAIDARNMDVLFGWDYFRYNGKEYNKLSTWINRYYRPQLKNVELNHTLDARLPSIRKKTAEASDHRYLVDATLHRKSALISTDRQDDFRLEDRTVTFTVIINEGHSLQILAIDGDWDFNPIYPKLKIRRSLSLDRHHSTLAHNGGRTNFKVASYLIKDKVYGMYGELDAVKNFQREKLNFGVSSDRKFEIDGETVTVYVPYNYSRREREYKVRIFQKDEMGKHINSQFHTIKQLGNKSRSITDVETDYLPTWNLNFHYGIRKTLGFSLNGRFRNLPVTLGVYVAPSMTRWKHLGNEFSEATSSGTSLSFLTKTEEVDGYRVKTSWNEFSRPGKRDYSSEWDPDSTAAHKQALSYVFIQPGGFITEWLHMEVGFGFMRFQDTYLVDNLPEKVTKEYTPLDSLYPPKETETVYVDSGKSFLFKDRADYSLACRYGVNFNIPLGKRKALKLGTGIIMADVWNWDFNLGFSWHLF